MSRDHRLRLACWRLLCTILLGLASTIAYCGPAQQDTQLVRRAVLHGLAGEREVELPHVLEPGDFAPEGSRVRYRLQLELPAPPAEPLGIFVRKLSLAGALSLNGVEVGACGIGALERLRCLHQPHLFVPPPTLWREGSNTIEFELQANRRQMNGLSQVQVGPAEVLDQGPYGRSRLLLVDLVLGLSWLLLCLGLLSLAVNVVLQGGERVYLWFGLAALVNALSNLNVLVSTPRVSVELFSWFVFTTRFVSAPLIFLTILALFGKDSVRLQRVLLGYAVLGSALIWALDNSRMATIALYVPVMLYGVGLLPAMLRWILHSRSGSHVLVSLAFAILLVASVIDWLRLSGQSPFVGVYLVAYSINAVMLFFGGLLVWRLAQSLNTTRQLATLLDHQVAERTADLEQANRRLAAMANTDSLTGIANRRHFDERLALQWERARCLARPLVLMLLDVDHFKKYNDHFGHPAGDDCLRRVAEVLQRHARGADELAARYGGEEFAILSLASAEQGRQQAEAVRQAIAALAIAHPSSPYGRLTISVGLVCALPSDLRDPGELLARADEALYRAKDGGRNRIEIAPLTAAPRGSERR